MINLKKQLKPNEINTFLGILPVETEVHSTFDVFLGADEDDSHGFCMILKDYHTRKKYAVTKANWDKQYSKGKSLTEDDEPMDFGDGLVRCMTYEEMIHHDPITGGYATDIWGNIPVDGAEDEVIWEEVVNYDNY